MPVFNQFDDVDERVSLELRGVGFDALNHPGVSAPNGTMGNTQFGHVTGAAHAPRQTPLGLRLFWQCIYGENGRFLDEGPPRLFRELDGSVKMGQRTIHDPWLD